MSEKIGNPASIAALFLSLILGALMYFGYDQVLAAGISVTGGILIFILLAAVELKKPDLTNLLIILKIFI